jgi:hypothetical protein
MSRRRDPFTSAFRASTAQSILARSAEMTALVAATQLITRVVNRVAAPLPAAARVAGLEVVIPGATRAAMAALVAQLAAAQQGVEAMAGAQAGTQEVVVTRAALPEAAMSAAGALPAATRVVTEAVPVR